MSEGESLHVLMMTGRITRRVESLHALEVARGLMELGHEVLVLCPRREEEIGRRYQWVPLWVSGALAHPVLKSVELGALLARVRDWGADVVHMETVEAARSGEVVRAHLGLAAVMTVYGTERSIGRVRRAAARGVRVIVPTEVIRQELVNRGRVPKEMIRVIASGVPEKTVEGPESWEEGAGRRAPVVGTFGALERGSGHEYFLEAAKAVVEAGAEAQFLVIGSGPGKRELRRKAAELGIREWVSFCDPSADVAEQLGTVDIFVMSGLDESQRPVTLEAMMQGKPVVAFGVGTTFEVVVNNQTGLLVPKGDSGKLGEAILRLIRKPDFAMRLGRQGREMVRERFSMRNTLEQTVGLYRQVMREQQMVPEEEAAE